MTACQLHDSTSRVASDAEWLGSLPAWCVTQGVFPPGTFGQLGLKSNWYGSVEWQYPPHQRQGAYEEEGRAINTLKVPLHSLSEDAVCLL